MPSPFPGMDPYLENPALWPGFHDSLIVAFKAQLNALIQPRYAALIEERVYITDQHDPGRQTFVPDLQITKPIGRGPKAITIGAEQMAAVAEPIEIELGDEENRDSFLTVYRLDNREVVTIIEVLSPTNKTRGSYGQELFRKKRREVLASATSWVEIDLLRSGDRFVPAEIATLSDYFVTVSRAGQRSRPKAWPIKLPQQLPSISIPLAESDSEVKLNLQDAINKVYDESAYAAVIDYAKNSIPALSPQYAAWADELLKAQGLR